MLLSAAGVLASIAGVVAIWVYRAPVTERVDRTCGRVDAALNQGGRPPLTDLSQLFERAGGNLKEVRKKIPPPGSDADKVQSFRDYIAQNMLKDVMPEDATPILQKLIATTTVANSVLSDLQDLPADSLPFLDKDQLSQMDDGVRQLAATSQKAADVLGTPVAGTDVDANQEISRIEEALNRIVEVIGKYRTQIQDVQQKAHAAQAKLDAVLLWGAVGATVLLAWFTVAQVSLFAHAWGWLRGPAAR